MNRVLSPRFYGTGWNKWGAQRNKWPSLRIFKVASSLGSDITRTNNSVYNGQASCELLYGRQNFPNGSTSTGRRWRVRLQRGRGTYHGEEERKSWRRYFIQRHTCPFLLLYSFLTCSQALGHCQAATSTLASHSRLVRCVKFSRRPASRSRMIVC